MCNRNIYKNIFKMATFFLGLLFILICYITYIQDYLGDSLYANPLNRRIYRQTEDFKRGTIFDCRGEKLAYSMKGNEGFIREYPFEEKFAHVVGYESLKLGNTGIEATYNSYLSGTDNIGRKLGAIQKFLSNTQGNDVYLTLDATLQQIAYEALTNHKGAVVALNPRTGEILAMVSKPAFNPNKIESSWEEIQQEHSGILLNRVTQGLYPPGSVFKTMIADAALREQVVTLQETISCPGYLQIGNYTLYESDEISHGEVDLKKALTVSCNTYFATMSLKLGPTKLENNFNRFGFNKMIETKDFPEADIKLPDFKQLNDGDLAQLGIGQGDLLVTPLRMAMLASVFANHGTIMEPHILNEIHTANGGIIKKYKIKKWLEVTSHENAKIIAEYMKNVVANGTGTRAQISSINVAGKTGTAENAQGKPHAWFIGFAPVENPKIVIAVIVENGGSGGSVAAPIAKKVIAKALSEEVSQ